MAGGKPNQPYRSIGTGTSSHQVPQYQTLSRPRLPIMETLNLLDLLKLMNNPVRHDLTWTPIPIKFPLDIPTKTLVLKP